MASLSLLAQVDPLLAQVDSSLAQVVPALAYGRLLTGMKVHYKSMR